MNIIELATEAGWTESTWEGFLTKFAALVRAEALEECAKRSEAYAYMSDNFNVLAAEIRGLK